MHALIGFALDRQHLNNLNSKYNLSSDRAPLTLEHTNSGLNLPSRMIQFGGREDLSEEHEDELAAQGRWQPVSTRIFRSESTFHHKIYRILVILNVLKGSALAVE